jgi:hypothetical protein
MTRLWAFVSYPFRRQRRKPFAARRPGRDEMGQVRSVPLGMEATDLTLIDRVSRQNDALERSHPIGQRRSGLLGARTSTHIDAMPEDETYAARYHSAYLKKDS